MIINSIVTKLQTRISSRRIRPIVSSLVVLLVAACVVVMQAATNGGEPETNAPRLSPPESTANTPGEPNDQLQAQQQRLLDAYERYLASRLQLAASSTTQSVQLDRVVGIGTIDGDYAKLSMRFTAAIDQPLFAPARLSIGLPNFIVTDVKHIGDFGSRVVPATSLNESVLGTADSSATAVSTNQDDSASTSASISSMESRALIWEITSTADSLTVADFAAGVSEPQQSFPKTCELQLEGYLRITTEGRARKLVFDLPQIVSDLTIDFTENATNIDWPTATNQKLDVVSVGSGVRLHRVGMGTTSTLSWMDSGETDSVQSIEIESNTRFETQLDDKAWNAITRLVVKSRIATSTRDFELRLPPGASWNPTTETTTRSGWSLVKLDAPTGSSATDTAQGPRLQLRVSADELAKSSNPIEVRWQWQPTAKSSETFPIHTISIADAERHYGTIELLMPARTLFKWKTSGLSNLWKRTVEPGTPEQLNYTFQFAKTPVDIECSLEETAESIQYRPEYIASITDDAVNFTGYLSFSVDPSQMVGLEIEAPEWDVQEVVWHQNEQPIEFTTDENGSIQFDPVSLFRRPDSSSSSSASNGRVVRVTMIKPLTDSQKNGDEPVTLQPPAIVWLGEQGKEERQIGNGWLSIATPDWQVEKSSVTTESLTPLEELPLNTAAYVAQNKTLSLQSYLFDERSSPPTWHGTLQRKPNLATQDVATSIRILENGYRLQKTWKIKQNNWKDLQFELIVPSAIAEQLAATDDTLPLSTTANFTKDGTRVRCLIATASTDEAQDGAPVAVSKNVPEGWKVIIPQLGDTPEQFELKLELRSSLFEEVASDTSTSNKRPVQLAIPFLQSQNALMTVDKTMTFGVNAEWKAIIPVANDEITVYPGQTIEPPMADAMGVFDLTLEKLSIVRPSSVQVNQVWLQTAINNSDRRDRCVIDLTTAANQIELELTNSENAIFTQALVNGQRKDPRRIEGSSSWIIMLSPTTGNSTVQTSATANSDGSVAGDEALLSPESQPTNQRYTVELWLWSRVSRGYVDRLNETLPLIKNATEPAPKIWQVLVPEYDHLWTASDRLMPEFQWKWRGLSLQRVNALEQSDLERRTGASAQKTFGLEANRYLFSNFASSFEMGKVSRPEYVYVVPRYVLFTPICLACILITCLLLYVPATRSVWTLGFLATLAAIFAFASTDIAILMTQAIAGSLFFVGLLLLLRWSITRRVYRRSVFANRSRTGSSTIAPTDPVDFGYDEKSSTARTEQSNQLARGRSSVIGTTRSLQLDVADRESDSRRGQTSESIIEGL